MDAADNSDHDFAVRVRVYHPLLTSPDVQPYLQYYDPQRILAVR